MSAPRLDESFSPTFAWSANCLAEITESSGLQLLPGDPDLHVRYRRERLDVHPHPDGLLLSYSRETPTPQAEQTAKGSSSRVELTRELPSPCIVSSQGVFLRLDDTPELQLELERRRNPFGDMSMFPARVRRDLAVYGEMDSFANVEIRAARDWQHLLGDYLGDAWTPGETRRRSSETLGFGNAMPVNVVTRTITFDGAFDSTTDGVRRCVKYSGTTAVEEYPQSSMEEYAIFDADTMRPLETGTLMTMNATAPRSPATADLPLERVVTRRRYHWVSR